ncbi:MAG: type II secretion system F family protein [Armatimonadota bacterium]
MPVFEYRGNTREGTAVRGTLQATNKQAALAELRAQGIWLTDLQDAAARPTAIAGRQWSLVHAIWPLNKMQASILFRQLAALMRAGVGPHAALTAVQDRVQGGRLRRMLQGMADEAGRGDSISDIFRRRGHAFGPFVPQMMAVGERTGRLDVVCDQIAQQYELEWRLWRSLALQKTYFWGIICVGICIPSLPGYIIQETFSWEHFADYGRHFVHVLLPIIFGLLFGAKLLHIALHAPPLRRVGDWIHVRYPLTGPIVRQAATARFLRTMSAMFEAGVPVADCVEAAAGATANVALARPILQHAPILRQGGRVAQVLHGADVFSSTAVGMIATGEESGTLPEALRHLAGLYEAESESRLARLRWHSYAIVVLVGSLFVILFGGLSLTAYYDRIFELTEEMMP